MSTEIRKINIKTPPQNFEAEQALLGSIIQDNNIIKEISKIVKTSSFSNEKNGLIYNSLLQVHKNSGSVDLLTLTDYLQKNDKLDFIGGMSYLTELISCVPTSSNATQYARVVQDKYLRRQLILISEKVANASYDESLDISSTLNRTIKSLKTVDDIICSSDKTEEEKRKEKIKEDAKNYDGEDKVVTFNSIAEDIRAGDKTPKYFTGWTGLDDLLSGLKPKHIIILSGIMKHGKTSFAMDMIHKMSEYNPLLLALEEPIEELIEKFMERGETPPHGFSPKYASFVNTEWIELKIAEGIEKYGSRIVFIDNLDWVGPTGGNKDENETQQIKRTVMELKRIAKKWSICIVLIVHVTKNSKANMNPTYEDFSGSSAIGKIADKAIIIWRETNKGNRGELEVTNNTNVSVQLNRQGKVGLVKMVYESGHYREHDWIPEDGGFGDFSEDKLQHSKSF